MKRPINLYVLKSDRGSLSVEALFSATCLLLFMLVLSLILRTLYIYDSVDYSIHNASKHISVNEGFILLAQSGGAAETISRPLIVKSFIKAELKKNDFILNRESDAFDVLKVNELSDFDIGIGAGTYVISYDLPLIGNLPDVKMTHQIRIRSIWQSANDDNNHEVNMVYTTPHGRENKIYHTYVSCWSLKRSWENPESVHTSYIDKLEGFRQCKICSKEEASEE